MALTSKRSIERACGDLALEQATARIGYVVFGACWDSRLGADRQLIARIRDRYQAVAYQGQLASLTAMIGAILGGNGTNEPSAGWPLAGEQWDGADHHGRDDEPVPDLKDFPPGKVPAHLRVVSPDEFILALLSTHLDTVVDVVEARVRSSRSSARRWARRSIRRTSTTSCRPPRLAQVSADGRRTSYGTPQPRC